MKDKDKLKYTASDNNQNKISIHNNYEANQQELEYKEMQKLSQKPSENQLIYTFRENSKRSSNWEDPRDQVEASQRQNHPHIQTIDTDFKEKSVKMNKKDLFPENEKFSTITRNNKALEKALLSVNTSKKDFYNTGKWIENFKPSDLNILKGYMNSEDIGNWSTIEYNNPTLNNRDNFHKEDYKDKGKRVWTERRDGHRNKSKKHHLPVKAEEIGLEENTKGFNSYMELYKKYAKLKKIARK